LKCLSVYYKCNVVVGTGKTYVKPEPLGVALVISAWNFPIYTALPFVAAAIAAGNCIILKPSEISPNTSKIMKQLFDDYLDSHYYRCIEGKVEVAKALVSSKVDLILFTGSTKTGNSVAIEAEKNLVPCVL
jgi:aldehyde dehydrogenase (NAD+)